MMLEGDYCFLVETDDFAGFVRHVTPELDAKILRALLQDAASDDRVRFLEHLNSVGVDLSQRIGSFEANALAYAARENSLNAIKYLHKNGLEFDLHSTTTNPLVMAAQEGHLETVKWLAEAGCDPHVIYGADDNVFNAYKFAVNYGHQEVAEYLRSIGCQLPEEGSGAISTTDSTSGKTKDPDTDSEVVGHLAEHFGAVDELSAQEIFSPLGAASVAVNFIQPNSNHNYLTLFSAGPSNQALKTPDDKTDFQYAEFVMHLPADWPHPREADPEWQWPVSYFKQIAYFGLLNDTWLSDNGKIIVMAYEDDWPQSAELSEVLLMPDIVPPLQADRLIRFYSIIPLTPQVHALGSEGGPPRIREAIDSGELDITSAWTGLLKK